MNIAVETDGWSWHTTLDAFLADNADGLSPDEIEAIRASLEAGQAHSVGGGAAPLVTLYPRR